MEIEIVEKCCNWFLNVGLFCGMAVGAWAVLAIESICNVISKSKKKTN